MNISFSDFSARRNDILNKIKSAASIANRNAEEITLVAACKTQASETIDMAIKCGQLVFGENRVQEGEIHFSNSKPNNVETRLIGPLQSNKTQEAFAIFDVIETLDRPNLAKEISKLIQKGHKSPKFLVQVNIGEEPQKGGVLPQKLDRFIEELKRIYEIQPIGLMCIPPFDRPPAQYFALLAKMAKFHGLSQLSMGMSGDFESAIKFGATHVRIGTALFGERN